MRRSLSLLCSVLFCSSLWAEDYIPFSQPTWTKENPKTALYIMPRSIDREDRDQSYLMVLVDSWGDGWNGASVDVTINNDETLLTGLTITSGNEAAFEVDVDDFDYLTTSWNPGSYDSECSWGLYDPDGMMVFGSGLDVTLSLAYTVDFSGINEFANSGFEGISSSSPHGHPAEWAFYPGNNDWNGNKSLETTGNEIYNSSETFVAYDGNKSMKMWEAGENNTYFEYMGENVPIPGTTFNLSGMLYSHVDDFVQGDNKVSLMVKYFGFGPNGDGGAWWETMIDHDPSTPEVEFHRSEVVIDASSTPSTWTEATLSTVVPEGVFNMQIGVVYTGNAGGSVYFDNVVAERLDPVLGCTDALACNYDDLASVDDGSCCFYGCNEIDISSNPWPSENSWTITDEAGTIVLEAGTEDDGFGYPVGGGTPYSDLLCVDDGTYTFNAFDSYGDGWNGSLVTILDSMGRTALSWTLPTGSSGSVEFTLPAPAPSEPQVALIGVLDLTVPAGGNSGKAAVIQAITDVEDLSWYGYESCSNSNPCEGPEMMFPSMQLDSGEVVWFVRDVAEYQAYFGADWDWGAGIFEVGGDAVNGNGDDGMALYLDGVMIDRFGADIDGDNEPWNYLDSWALRLCSEDLSIPRTPSTTFDIADWQMGGVNCSDGSADNASSSCPFPSDYTCLYLPGCTDELALNYDPLATANEGCLYTGDVPDVPLTAVLGDNQADGDTEFFLYTMVADGFLTVSSQNAAGDATNDVTLSLHDPVTLALLTDLDGFPAENDDCCDYFGPSTVEIPVAGAESVLLQWNQPYDTEGPFTFTVTEGPVPNHPRLLNGMTGFNTAMLSWQPFIDPFPGQGTNLRASMSGLLEEETQRRGEYRRNKIATLGIEDTPRPSFVFTNSETDNTRDPALGMTILVDGGSWQGEVSWALYGPTADLVASGGAGAPVQIAPGLTTHGSYVFLGMDSFGDGWNGNTATITSLDADGNTVTHLDGWTIASGSMELVEFVTEGSAELTAPEFSLSNFTFDQTQGEGIVSVDITNSGERHAINVSVGHFLFNAASAGCNTGASFPDGEILVPAGQTVTHQVGGIMWWLETYIGSVYGSYDYGVMVDYTCEFTEINEDDNLLITPMEILSDTRYNVYSSVDGGANYDLLSTELIDNFYIAEDLVSGDYTFAVSQYDINDAVESQLSPGLDLYVFGNDDYPAPLDLVGSVDGPGVELIWTAPDLTDWEGNRLASVFVPGNYPKEPVTESSSSSSSSSRQGGDTFDDATVIESLPYEMDGTTVGYAIDYGPWGTLVDADADGEPDVCYGGTYFSAANTGAGPDVAYSLTLDQETDLEAEVCQAAYDPSLAIFTMEENANGEMEMVVVAASDDVCGDDGYKPYVNCLLPAGDYYIVVSGWGAASSGEYTLLVRDMGAVPPISNYTVYRTDPNGVENAFVVPGDVTSFDQIVFVPEVGPEGGDFSFEVTANYWEDMVESLPSNEVMLTTTAPSFECEAPRNLVAESMMGNNVNLTWDTPAGGPSYVTHFDGTIAFVWGSGLDADGLPIPVEYNAISVFSGGEMLPYHGMELTHVDFIPFNRFDLVPEATATYQAKVWNIETGEVLSESEIVSLADYLPLAVAPDPLEIASLALNNPVTIDWAVPLAFGIHTVGSGYPMMMDAGSEGGSYRLDSFEGAEIVEHAYDWTIWGYIDYASTGGERIAIGSEGSMNFETAEYEGLSRAVENEHTSFSELPNRPARDLLSYNVYRGDMHVGMAGLEENMFMDDWVPWGDHNYHVTAMYNNSVECGESGSSNVVEVMLENTPPNGVNLNSPQNEANYEVTFDVDADGLPVANNLGTSIPISWTQAPDVDNQPVTYIFGAQIVVTEDQTVLDEFSLGDENMLMNSDFEDVDAGGAMVDWINYQADGAHALVSDEDGNHVQIWGMGDLTFGSVYQSHILADLDLSDGDLVSVDGHLKRTDDMGNNSAYVFLSFWNADYTSMLGFVTSAHMDMTMPAGDWHQFMALATVPEGAVNMNAGVEYLNPDMVSVDADGLPVASVHADNIHVMNPIPPQTPLMPTLGDIAEEAMMDLVTNLTVHWDVHSYDGWEATTSANGPFHFTVDMSAYVSEYLSTDEENSLPDVFALYNNYPNPFNPVTNITYDVPEVADVKLEIFNVMGQKVRTLASGSHEPGRYRVLWNATNDFGEGLSSGMYIYKIQAGDFMSVKKLVLMK